MNANQKRIVVYGGTGYYGKYAVTELLKLNQNVRVVSRSKKNVRELFGDNVEVTIGDVKDKSIIQKTLEDVDAILISLSAMSPKLIRRMREIEYVAVDQILKMAKAKGINRVVFISVYALRFDVLKKLGIEDFAIVKSEAEEAVKSSGLNYTILGCPPSHELFFTLYRNAKLPIPGGGKNKTPTVAGSDVGTIAAQCLLRNDLSGKRFKVAEPKCYTFPEVAELISQEIGKPVRLIAIPLALLNIGSFLLKPFYPFLRYLYKSLVLLNNFPRDEVDKVPEVYQELKDNFQFESLTLEMAIKNRHKNQEL